MSGNDDPFDTFSEQTLRRAEEMCEGLEMGLSLDRRGQARHYRGFLTDLSDLEEHNIEVDVAEVSDQPWVTVVTDRPLDACDKALLVFRMPPAEDMKYFGRHTAARPGKRGEPDRGRYVLTFEIVRDARKG